jgi:hypothetical protein
VKDVCIRSWSAWAPGLETRDAWQQWASDPSVPGADDAPAAKFLPSLLRRRCTPLTRMMLTAAFDCLGEVSSQSVRPVFSSRHGSINESISMLEKVAVEQRLSPAMFAHTVHNAQAALFSIAAENRASSSALCAERESFEAGYIEALVQLSREPAQPVLLVVGDVPLAPGFASLIDEPVSAYAMALLLELGEGDSAIAFEMPQISNAGTAPDYAWPTALEFLRWLLTGEKQLDLIGSRHGWRWKR